MKHRPFLFALLVGVLVWTTGACSFAIKVGQIPSAKTDLEEQVLGTYREIDDELVMISTVRGDTPGAAATTLADKVKYARQNQKFNLDDIEELKSAQILGESADGQLVTVPQEVSRLSSQPEALLRLAQILMVEENADRQVIWEEILARQANVGNDRLAEVRRSFANLKQKDCKVGQWYQSANGQWVRKINEQQ